MSAQLYCGDCLEIMAQMPAYSVDLVFFSPPYEDCRTYGIDFRLKGQAYVDWMVKVFTLCRRLCKGLVACVIEGKTSKFRYSATPLLLAADLHRAGFVLRKPPIFNRVGIPGSGGPDWLRNDYEFLICTTRGGKLPWSQNTACGHPPKWAPGGAMSYRNADGVRKNARGYTGNQWGARSKVGNRKKDGTRQKAGRPSNVRIEHDKNGNVKGGHDRILNLTLANPGNKIQQAYTAEQVAKVIADYEAGNVRSHIVGGGVMGGDEFCSQNEAPFPEALPEFFIRSFCRPGGTVLDPFVGSGTTLAVAKRLGRNGIGIDLRQSQIDLTSRRLAQQGVVASGS